VDTLEVEATTGAPQTVPVYGQIPGGQRVRDGIYSDTITVRVLF
jgi:spore coat protein U-like protein